MFSRRVPSDLRPNALARLRRRRPSVGYDLTVSNPTACGIAYPAELLRDLARAEGLAYRPHARGMPAARRAVAGEYRRHGLEIDPERVVLTASTSEAYSFLFKVLCDPGDAVRVPVPSYPLLAHLAALDGVVAAPYRLEPELGWQPAAPDDGPPEGTRALIAVHPNNPTGSFLEPAAGDGLARACSAAGMAWIVDEVFLDYALEPGAAPRSFAATDEVLTFALGGLSKSVGLPQLKLSWIVVGGPEADAREALARLEFVADNYLSVATPVQLAAADLLAAGAAVREAIRERCRGNAAALRELAGGHAMVDYAPPAGGWSAVVRFPRNADENALAIELLERRDVAVYPGYFFDFPDNGYVVVSLLPEPGVFREGVRRLLELVAERSR